ncbi:cob(I)yrinic acid a,c-diamide adenosyltransferase [Algicola sagamiensis]|uniref:cob(I)yrinic acid a,c-diamide adenosyltransferase n=1 Tax=Algicola sagamiensis TaxID=163869 RepID=UPI000366577B|nr:cob(I)yrinic acid a,c-diamide adenosyltransferase [Algicola sagamiensis]
MKIYTKTGDQGMTQIYADKTTRVRKDSVELALYGTLDQLNALVGLLCCELTGDEQISKLTPALQQIQQNLFQLGYGISAQKVLDDSQTEQLEQAIDHFYAELPPQTSFILPSGTKAACTAHLCRTTTRQAERMMVGIQDHYDIPTNHLRFLNRLSDYFFALARWLNASRDVQEVPVP